MKTITGKQAYFIILGRRKKELMNRLRKILEKTQLEWLKLQTAIVKARP